MHACKCKHFHTFSKTHTHVFTHVWIVSSTSLEFVSIYVLFRSTIKHNKQEQAKSELVIRISSFGVKMGMASIGCPAQTRAR